MIWKGRIKMRFYYGEKNLHRVLDEMEFWKHQESEHTVVIREVASDLEPAFVCRLQQFERAFQQTEGLTVRYIETIIRSKGDIGPDMQQQIMELIRFAICQSQQFILLLNQILAESAAAQNNSAVSVVVNHIRRESEYFIGIAQTILSC